MSNMAATSTQRCIQNVNIRVLMTILIVTVIAIVGYISRSLVTQHPVFYSSIASIHESMCSLPVLDPFDESIQRFLWKPEPLDCYMFPSVVYMDENSVCNLNTSAFEFFHIDSSIPISCTVDPITQSKDPFEVDYWGFQTVHLPTKFRDSDFNMVKCLHNGTVVYDNVVASIRENIRQNKPALKEETDDQLSVHLISLDSVSRSASIRSLPKTLDYLKTLGAHDFRGLMTIGANTPPNLFGLLTGKELPDDRNSDPMSFIWNNFSRRHYTTMYAVDGWSPYMIHHGFRYVNTDHCMRPYWNGVWTQKVRTLEDSSEIYRLLNESKKRDSSKFCQQNTKSFVETMKYLRRFMSHYAKKRKFSFTMLEEVSHDNINYLPYLDEDLKSFLTWLKEGRFMEKSIIVVFGDHGSRYQGLRDSTIGRIESRMPMLHVIIPEHIKKRYPEVETNLNANTHRLVTLFDVYQTLVDVLNNNYGNPSTHFVDGKARRVSLFKEVSRSRSCREAGIPAEFCACYNTSKAIDLTYNRAFDDVAETIVDHINSVLSDEPKCQTLKLLRPLSAEQIYVEPKQDFNANSKSAFLHFLNPNKEATESFNIRIETKPGFAMFDVTCELDLEGKLIQVVNVDRTNAYGNQSHCVTDPKLREYCYC